MSPLSQGRGERQLEAGLLSLVTSLGNYTSAGIINLSAGVMLKLIESLLKLVASRAVALARVRLHCPGGGVLTFAPRRRPLRAEPTPI